MLAQRFTVNSCVAYDQAGQQDHLAELGSGLPQPLFYYLRIGTALA